MKVKYAFLAVLLLVLFSSCDLFFPKHEVFYWTFGELSPVISEEYRVGETVTVADGITSDGGSTFAGWYMEVYGYAGVVRQPGYTFEMPDSQVNFTATWE